MTVRSFILRGLVLLCAILPLASPAKALAAPVPTWAPQKLLISPSFFAADDPVIETNLTGVSCPSSTDCYAVGGFSTRFGDEPARLAYDPFNQLSLIEHWNGTTWNMVQAPALPNHGVFLAISCSSTSFCIAMGFGEADILRGGVWHFTTAGLNAVADPVSLSCANAHSCMVVGMHTRATNARDASALWTGNRWVPKSVPYIYEDNTVLPQVVSCPTAGDCFASAISGTDVMLRFVHDSWRVMQEQPRVEDMHGVSCVTASWCMEVGDAQQLHAGSPMRAEIWNGSRWSKADEVAPQPSLDGIGDDATVSCTSETVCALVSDRLTVQKSSEYAGDAPWAEVWNGHEWISNQSYDPSNTSGWELDAVSCAPHTHACESVGNYSSAAKFNPLDAPPILPFVEGFR